MNAFHNQKFGQTSKHSFKFKFTKACIWIINLHSYIKKNLFFIAFAPGYKDLYILNKNINNTNTLNN